MVNVFQNIFAAIYCPPGDLHAAKNRISKFQFFRILWDFENRRNGSRIGDNNDDDDDDDDDEV